MKNKLFLSIALSLTALISQAQSSQKVVTQFMDKSGMAEQFAQMDGMIGPQLDAAKARFDDGARFDAFKEAMLKNFNSTEIAADFENYLIRQADETKLQNIIKWYDEPVFKKMKEMEVNNSGIEKQAELMTFMQSLQQNPLPAERNALIKDLFTSQKVTDFFFGMMKETMGAMMQGMNLAMPAKERMSPEELNSTIDASFPEGLKAQLEPQLITSYAFVYQNATDAELKEFTKYYQSELGQYYLDMTFSAMESAFIKVGEKLGEDIPSALGMDSSL